MGRTSLLSVGNLPAQLFDRAAFFLGVEDAPLDAAGAGAVASADFLPLGAPGCRGCAALFLQRVGEALAGELAIGGLRAGVLDGHGGAARGVPERDCRGDLVDMLPARARGTGERLLDIRIGKLTWSCRTAWNVREPFTASCGKGN